MSDPSFLTGQQGHGSKHPCFVCDGYRVDQHGRNPAGDEGRWIPGYFRSLFTAFRDYNGFLANGYILRNAMHFNNHVREPIRLHVDENRPFHEYIKIDPLHIVKLGCENDVFTKLGNLDVFIPDRISSSLVDNSVSALAPAHVPPHNPHAWI